jgi:hypothetical protein
MLPEVISTRRDIGSLATWAIYRLASYYSHSKKRITLDQFMDDALPLVAFNLEQFA